LVPAGSGPQRVHGIHQEFPIALAPYLSLGEQISLFKNTGATAVRQRMRWDEIETTQGLFDWAQMDAVIDGFLSAGIDPLVDLRDTPAWAADPACTAEEVSTCPPNLDAWGNFVSSAVARYSGRVVNWEVWNEPSNVGMWAGTVQDYYWLLQRASTEIRSADPAARIVIGGMTHSSVLNQGPWLSLLLHGPDIQGAFDVFSFHLYGSVGQPEETFDALNALLAETGLSGKELWVTETNPQMGSEQEQAQALAGWFERIFLQGATRVYYFTFPNWCGDDLTWEKEWCDANVYDDPDIKPNGGLVHNVDFTPTLVYDAYRAMTGDPPAAPGNLTAAMSGANVVLNWQDNAATEIQFYVERCQGAGCTSFAGVGASDANQATWTDSSAAFGQSYSYRVRAGGLLDRYSDYSNTSTIVTPAPPLAPSNLTGKAFLRRRIKLTWTNNSTNQDGVRIERCRGFGCTNFTQVATVAGVETTYTDQGLAANTYYRYRVCAYNSIGSSPCSNTVRAKTLR